MDRNFAMAPQGFTQIYVIRVPLGDTAVSTVYACLQGKSQDVYETFLQAIMDHCQTLNAYPDPRTVIVDFEKAVIQAISAVFGPATSTQGCFYHLTQSTWRKIQGLGLFNVYKESDEFKQFCGELDGLAFLPVDDVAAGMEYLKDNCPDAAVPLLEYFDQTYVSGTFIQRSCHIPEDGVPAINFRRIPPRYPPELWNVSEATLNDNPRTNNMCEGWNNVLTFSWTPAPLHLETDILLPERRSRCECHHRSRQNRTATEEENKESVCGFTAATPKPL